MGDPDLTHDGFFITFEGPEGSGKSSQIILLAEHLKNLGLTVLATREPGGTRIGDRIRAVVHDVELVGMEPKTEALLYQASRAQLVPQEIIPTLEKGGIVILDRYADCSEVYQGAGRGLDVETIRFLNLFSTGGLTPDLTFLLDIDIKEGLIRKGKQGEINRMDLQESGFYRRTQQAYYDLVRSDESSRWVLVDGGRNPSEVKDEIIGVVEDRLVQRGLLEGNRFGPERG